jgi:hypothetical protein
MVRQRGSMQAGGVFSAAVQSSSIRSPRSPDDVAADEQSGWVTLGLYALGVLIYVVIGQQFLGLINFPPFMLVCLLATGWLGPILWRRPGPPSRRRLHR